VRRLLDAVGWPERAALTLLTLWVTWSWAASLFAGRVPSVTSPYVVSPVVLVIGVVLGRIVATRIPHDVVVAGLVTATAVLLVGVIWTEGPAKRPTAYANANAAVAVQVIGLAGLAMLGSDRTRKVALWLTTAGALGVIAANSSKAAFVVALPLLAAIALMSWRPARRAWWAVLTGAVSIAAVAVAVVHLAGLEPWTPEVTRALDPARQTLWSEALSLWVAHPVTGGGPGSLAEYSTLGGDPDTAAAHSSVLQVGAETGWVGVVLFAVVVLAGLLWATRGSAPSAVVAAAAWTALLVHSLTDHLLEFGPVVLAAGVAVGWAGASRPDGGEAAPADDHTGVTSTSG
jgi:O-antigen ligase